MRTEAPRLAESLLYNGRIHGEPGRGDVADALLISGDRVVDLGRRADLEPRISDPHARLVDLGGRAVLPAFIESHTHYHRAAVLSRFFLDFEALRPAGLDDVLAAVAARAAELGPAEWIQGDSISAARLAERRLPDRHELDRAAGGRPVVIRGIGKHVVAASSAALAAAGIDRTTEDPPGGRIERDADGEPTGILHERAKLRLDQSDPATVVPSPGPADRRAALRDAVRDLHRYGIGTIHEMVRLPDEAADWTALHADGTLGVRVRLFYRVHESPLDLGWLEALGIRRGLGDDRLAVLGVKVSVDGFCIFRNAAVHEPYLGEPENLGLLRVEPSRLDELVRRANAQGLQVAVHAVGPRAVDLALDAFAAAGPAVAGPHRIEHAYVDMDEGRLRRMASLGLVWSTQPAFRDAYPAEWTDAFGPERRDRIMPLGLAAPLGLPVILNSDVPCASVDPLRAIAAATEPRGRGPESVISRVDAWRAMTVVPADVAGEPHLGRLAPGTFADLVVLDDDPLASAASCEAFTVHGTMVAGRPAYSEGDLFP